jgi:hypothetical protein
LILLFESTFVILLASYENNPRLLILEIKYQGIFDTLHDMRFIP